MHLIRSLRITTLYPCKGSYGRLYPMIPKCEQQLILTLLIQTHTQPRIHLDAAKC